MSYQHPVTKQWIEDEQQRCRKLGNEKLEEFDASIKINKMWLQSYVDQLLKRSSVQQSNESLELSSIMKTPATVKRRIFDDARPTEPAQQIPPRPSGNSEITSFMQKLREKVQTSISTKLAQEAARKPEATEIPKPNVVAPKQMKSSPKRIKIDATLPTPSKITTSEIKAKDAPKLSDLTPLMAKPVETIPTQPQPAQSQSKLPVLKLANTQKEKPNYQFTKPHVEPKAQLPQQVKKLQLNTSANDEMRRKKLEQMQKSAQEPAGVTKEPELSSTREDETIIPRIPSETDESDQDSDSDDEDDGKKFNIPEWAKSPNLKEALSRQKAMKPEIIFGKVDALKLEDIFQGSSLKRFRVRSSSANWSKDKLTEAEAATYDKFMGFHNK